MNTLENIRSFWPRDQVFDFLIPDMPPDLDLTHGVILYLEGISVSFGGFKAVDDLNLYIQNGELRCIIGPNGAGKTTIMDIITGKTSPDTGSAWFGQRINLLKMNEPEIARSGIGRKFQKPTVFENHTVHDNLELAMVGNKQVWSTLTAKLNSVQQGNIEAVLETIGLKEKITARAGSLSHGQKQWLEIGMLLMQNPKLLLVDEPVAGMTQQETERTAELLTDLAGTRSVVVVEHDMEFVRSIAQEVTVLHQGRVLAEGRMDEVQNNQEVIEVYLGEENAPH